MSNNEKIQLADTLYKTSGIEVKGKYVIIDGEEYYQINNYDQIPSFFMNIVSDSDHWMFVSSSGGITAGRVNADLALFPYYTDDKITLDSENTGPKTIFHVVRMGRIYLWEPFSKQGAGIYQIERNIYKNVFGNRLIFEERNLDLDLYFRYSWKTSEKYGFIISSNLLNMGENGISIKLIGGIQNILPWGTTVDLQQRMSNLLNAYKRSELDTESFLGIFSLSAAISDLAEPSESLKATTVWHEGFNIEKYLLSSTQLDSFRRTGRILPETEVLGEPGAFFAYGKFKLESGKNREWHIVAEVNQDSNAIVFLKNNLEVDRKETFKKTEKDAADGTRNLLRIIGNADGLQCGNDRLSTAHHFTNVLYNSMRGGTFFYNYDIKKKNIIEYICKARPILIKEFTDNFTRLPDIIKSDELTAWVENINSPDLNRLCKQYLPLTFSRRHGDPSRPWNKFIISLKNEDGSINFNYQGNWRDIFQNWEALAYSFPEYTENMIFRFLNSTTVEGYNPYRIYLDAIDWEKPEPSDPWSNIGYWSDHQIIYLQKLLEISLNFHPELLPELIQKRIFAYANVPYRIKDYESILRNPYETIEFVTGEDLRIETLVAEMGTDGQLVLDENGKVLHVNFTEKILTLLLAKFSNFIPGGGIWMNTQRPEWNDGNNALAGKGLSVVTVCYLRRMLKFLLSLYDSISEDTFIINAEVLSWFHSISETFTGYKTALSGNFDDKTRKSFMDKVGSAGAGYRKKLAGRYFKNDHRSLKRTTLLEFLRTSLEYMEHCIRTNRREDGLYHSYNILHSDDEKLFVSHLYEMLEGQVAVLSSGLLKPEESLGVLLSLRKSKMFRKDQHSYMLYPDRRLPGFLEKNCIPGNKVEKIKLFDKLIEKNDRTLIRKDLNGTFHFHGDFHNSKDVRRTLDNLRQDEKYTALVDAEGISIIDIFEDTFKHKEFTGRSGTFFAYEGLGSIFWHMVSKLLLAAQEVLVSSVELNENPEITGRLVRCYNDIRNGLGYKKSCDRYGAFPTDPHSHTPADKGAKQPGMTGQVKEEIITRLVELGVFVRNGCIIFRPDMLDKEEFLKLPRMFSFFDIFGEEKIIPLEAGSLAITFCQVPVIWKISDNNGIRIEFSDETSTDIEGYIIPAELSRKIFKREGFIKKIIVSAVLIQLK